MSDNNTVNITIDGKQYTVPKGIVVWEAARLVGIEIPIYCYHPKMGPLGACRICMVGIEKNRPPITTACTVQVAEGQVISTNTPDVMKARKGIMEFLLINHPLDCPICDKGGECPLQDYTMRYGPGASRFLEEKRHMEKAFDLGHNIKLDRERCIQCQRCARFSQLIALDENPLIMQERGFRTEIATYNDTPYNSQFSGNTIEMCPVGALTAKTYRFKARPWELRQSANVCPHCSVGCNITVDIRQAKEVVRFRSRTNDNIDDGWLCDRGRYGYSFIHAEERLKQPMLKRNGNFEEVTWDEALDFIAQRLQEIAQQHGANAIGAISSPSNSNEDLFLFQKLMRNVIGSPNVDYRHGLYFPAAADGSSPITASIAGLDSAKVIVLVAADPTNRQPVIDLRIKKAIRNGAKLVIISNQATDLDRLATAVLPYKTGELRTLLGTLSNLLVQSGSNAENPPVYPKGMREAVAGFKPEAVTASGAITADQLNAVAQLIGSTQPCTILYDEAFTLSEDGATLLDDVVQLAAAAGCLGKAPHGLGVLTNHSNTIGARDVGFVPDYLPGYAPATQRGLSYLEMLTGGVKALWVMDENPAVYNEDMGKFDLLIQQTVVTNETSEHADVLLPAASFVEVDGSYTNMDWTVQRTFRGIRPLYGSRPHGEILAEIARRLGKPFPTYKPSEVMQEITQAVPFYSGMSYAQLGDVGRRVDTHLHLSPDLPVSHANLDWLRTNAPGGSQGRIA